MRTVRRSLLYGGVAAVFAAIGGWTAWRRLAPTEISDADLAAVRLLHAQSLTDSAGRDFPLAGLQGMTVVLNFWATWCPPCVDEMPELASLHREIAPLNGTVIGIGIDSPSKIREFSERHRFPYPLLLGGVTGNELGRQLGNTSGAIPYTVVIDAKGRIIEKKLGRIRLADLRSKVFAAIGKPG